MYSYEFEGQLYKAQIELFEASEMSCKICITVAKEIVY